jgi:hypothetical protein
MISRRGLFGLLAGLAAVPVVNKIAPTITDWSWIRAKGPPLKKTLGQMMAEDLRAQSAKRGFGARMLEVRGQPRLAGVLDEVNFYPATEKQCAAYGLNGCKIEPPPPPEPPAPPAAPRRMILKRYTMPTFPPQDRVILQDEKPQPDKI